MMLLANCNWERCLSINGKLVVPGENKKNQDKVVLNAIVADINDADEAFKLLSRDNVECLTFTSEARVDRCPQEVFGKVFNVYTLDDLESGLINPIEGVVDLIYLPKDYSDMRTLKNYCSQYPNVRFTGGKLLNIEGVRIGRFDKGKESMSPVMQDLYDNFLEVDFDEINNIQEVVKKVRAKVDRPSGSSDKKEKVSVVKENRQSKKVLAFQGMFGASEVDF